MTLLTLAMEGGFRLGGESHHSGVGRVKRERALTLRRPSRLAALSNDARPTTRGCAVVKSFAVGLIGLTRPSAPIIVPSFDGGAR
jgi:hypothetical protein